MLKLEILKSQISWEGKHVLRLTSADSQIPLYQYIQFYLYIFLINISR